MSEADLFFFFFLPRIFTFIKNKEDGFYQFAKKVI